MKRIQLVLLPTIVIFTVTGIAHADTVFTPSASTQTLATIDTKSLTVKTVGPFDAPQDPNAAATLAISGAFSSDGTKLYTLLNGLAETEENISSQLASIDKITGKITTLGDKHPLNLVGMEIDANDKLLVTGFDLNPNPAFPGLNWFGDSKLYEMDKANGALTEIGETNIADGPIMDLAFDTSGALWATTRNKLWTLNTATGESTHKADITGVTESRPEGAEIMGIYFDSNNSLFGTDVVTGDLFTIDSTTGAATFVKATGIANPHGGDILVPEPSGLLLLLIGLLCMRYRTNHGSSLG